jgi:hypothetical protein
MCSHEIRVHADVAAIDRLGREITELASHIHAATCRWLGLVAEFDRRQGWAQEGCKSCAHWISWRCAIAPSAAREHVRVAHRLEELSQIRAAFAAGRLSYSKVRALTRVENVQREDILLMLAEHATAAQLERLLRAHRSVVRVDQAAAGRTPRRFVTWEHDDDGSLLLHARLPAEEGEIVLAALNAGIDHLRAAPTTLPAAASAEAPAADGESADPPPLPTHASAEAPGAQHESPDRPPLPTHASAEALRAHDDAPPEPAPTVSERRADALVLMADTLLAQEPQARAGDRYQVVLHVDTDALASNADGGRCELADGAPLAVETARRLACDAAIVPLLERGGKPLSVGRKTRTVPPALRRALASRDRGCRFPGCTNRCSVDAHHIRHWAHGGSTSLDNLVQVCRFHHRLLHEGGYTVEAAGAGFVFRRPDGRQLRTVPRPPKGRVRALHEANRTWGRPDHPEACVAKSAGEPIDLALCVDAMLRAAPAEAPGI